MLWKRRQREGPRRPLRQYWARTPTPTDFLSSPPDLGLVDERIPGQIFPDEVDPSWADPGDAGASDPGDAGVSAPGAGRGSAASGEDPPPAS